MGAGILFSNRTHVLLGRKAYGKLRGKWSGFGGKREEGETAPQSAVREVLEEIYGIHDQPSLVSALVATLALERQSRYAGYTVYRATFEQLNQISKILRSSNMGAAHFPTGIPQTVAGLEREFKPVCNSEFTALRVFLISELDARVDKHVKRDLDV